MRQAARLLVSLLWGWHKPVAAVGGNCRLQHTLQAMCRPAGSCHQGGLRSKWRGLYFPPG
ncbi:hypothetical protein NY78_1407 [Desulfovibrio sp. TomC]|nr:hypothetical protein NY78_1407 [Desulfovibrio sp. TomC]